MHYQIKTIKTMKKNFEDLTIDELWALRNEIVLNSLFYAHYENSFGFDCHDICVFFEGYVSFLDELANEDGLEDIDINELCDKYDDKENLWGWFCCYDDFSWVRFEQDKDKDEISAKDPCSMGFWNN